MKVNRGTKHELAWPVTGGMFEQEPQPIRYCHIRRDRPFLSPVSPDKGTHRYAMLPLRKAAYLEDTAGLPARNLSAAPIMQKHAAPP
jgi:hypothetical protein